MKNSTIPTLSEDFTKINQIYGLSYNLKLDQKSISKITFVLCFVLALLIQNLENFSQKLNFLFKSVLTWQNKNLFHPSDLIQAEIMLV